MCEGCNIKRRMGQIGDEINLKIQQWNHDFRADKLDKCRVGETDAHKLIDEYFGNQGKLIAFEMDNEGDEEHPLSGMEQFSKIMGGH